METIHFAFRCYSWKPNVLLLRNGYNVESSIFEVLEEEDAEIYYNELYKDIGIRVHTTFLLYFKASYNHQMILQCSLNYAEITIVIKISFTSYKIVYVSLCFLLVTKSDDRKALNICYK